MQKMKNLRKMDMWMSVIGGVAAGSIIFASIQMHHPEKSILTTSGLCLSVTVLTMCIFYIFCGLVDSFLKKFH